MEPLLHQDIHLCFLSFLFVFLFQANTSLLQGVESLASVLAVSKWADTKLLAVGINAWADCHPPPWICACLWPLGCRTLGCWVLGCQVLGCRSPGHDGPGRALGRHGCRVVVVVAVVVVAVVVVVVGEGGGGGGAVVGGVVDVVAIIVGVVVSLESPQALD